MSSVLISTFYDLNTNNIGYEIVSVFPTFQEALLAEVQANREIYFTKNISFYPDFYPSEFLKYNILSFEDYFTLKNLLLPTLTDNAFKISIKKNSPITDIITGSLGYNAYLSNLLFMRFD